MENISNHPSAILYADYNELKAIGIKHVIDQGINNFGFRNKTIICVDGSQWDYIPEDQIYEQRIEKLFHVTQ